MKDVAFAVDDAAGMFAEAVARGAAPVREPVTETDEFGSVVIATVKTYGDTVHSFVQRNGYKVSRHVACNAFFKVSARVRYDAIPDRCASEPHLYPEFAVIGGQQSLKASDVRFCVFYDVRCVFLRVRSCLDTAP